MHRISIGDSGGPQPEWLSDALLGRMKDVGAGALWGKRRHDGRRLGRPCRSRQSARSMEKGLEEHHHGRRVGLHVATRPQRRARVRRRGRVVRCRGRGVLTSPLPTLAVVVLGILVVLGIVVVMCARWLSIAWAPRAIAICLARAVLRVRTRQRVEGNALHQQDPREQQRDTAHPRGDCAGGDVGRTVPHAGPSCWGMRCQRTR